MNILPNFNTKHFCISHWKDSSIFYYNSENIVLQLCCKSGSIIIDKKIPLKDQPMLQQLRKEANEGITDGIYGKVCNYCLEKEKYNISSRRYNINKLRKKEIEDFKKEIENNNFKNLNKLSLLSLSTTRICNQACIMCRSDNSTFWDKYAKIFNDRQVYVTENDLDINLIQREIENSKDTLKHVFLSGGEFLLSKNYKQIIETIPNSPEIKLELVTALNLNSKKMIENLEHFLQRKNTLCMKISLHGTKDLYDIMSYPQKWNQFEKNFQFLMDNTKLLDNFSYRFSFAIGCLNIFDVDNIDIFTRKNNIICLTIDSPKYLSPFILKNKEFYLYMFYHDKIKDKNKFINYNFIEKLMEIHKNSKIIKEGDLQKIEKWRNIFKNFIKQWCEKTNTKEQLISYLKTKKLINLDLFSI